MKLFNRGIKEEEAIQYKFCPKCIGYYPMMFWSYHYRVEGRQFDARTVERFLCPNCNTVWDVGFHLPENSPYIK